MGIVVNGTNIPTDVANNLKVNNIDITKVICNSITVWEQNLGPVAWSGDSVYSRTNVDTEGITTSGLLFRATFRGATTSSDGGWLTVQDNDTIISGESITTSGYKIKVGPADTLYIGTSAGYASDYLIYAALVDKQFTGYSEKVHSSYVTFSLQTSGGLLRARATHDNNTTYAGAWIGVI